MLLTRKETRNELMNKYRKKKNDDQSSDKESKGYVASDNETASTNSKDMNSVELKDLGSMIKRLNNDEILVVDLQGEKNDK